MNETHQTSQTAARVAKGLFAGLVGGLVATAAKTLAERMFPPEPHEGHTPEGPIQWGFGAVAGAAYGALAEYYPAATAKDGASFGIALGSLVHQGAIPALGIGSAHDHEDETLRERASEVTSYLVYGVVAETVRRVVRKVL